MKKMRKRISARTVALTTAAGAAALAGSAEAEARIGVLHDAQVLCLAAPAAAIHLAHGDQFLASCTTTTTKKKAKKKTKKKAKKKAAKRKTKKKAKKKA
ncbi:MAG: hypothetical protein GWN29_03675 [Gammaproteobacteria bacterium]|nr:hypothetical protein [Gammaproteobacteria bacterium]